MLPLALCSGHYVVTDNFACGEQPDRYHAKVRVSLTLAALRQEGNQSAS